MDKIKCEVTSGTNVFIKANRAKVNLNASLYAVNWFSAKSEWLYHFYNFLASRSVKKIGGKAFFKGEVIKTILDENKASRDFILIVHYPGGENFKKLMESTYFKLVSVFRILSVKKFSFGFTKKQIASNSVLSANLKYAVHHFRAPVLEDSFFREINFLLRANVRITYAGVTIAQLFTQEKNKELIPIPSLMDGVIVFESNLESELLEMFASAVYKVFIEKLSSSYIGILKRTI